MFFIAYAFKGQVHVFAGRVKIVSHSSCRTSAIVKYVCPLPTFVMDSYNLCFEISSTMYPFQSTLHCTLLFEVFLIFTNSVHVDPNYAAFHLGHHCLQKYSFRGFLNT